MLWFRTTLVTLVVLAALGGCAAADDPDAATPDDERSATTTTSPATTTTETQRPTPTSPAPAPAGAFGAGDTFDLTSFAGQPVGTTLAEFADASGWTQDGCSAPGNALFTPAPTVADAAWVLYTPAYENEPDEDSDPQTWAIDEYALQIPDRTAAGRVGPVGPEGIQLGATAADVDAAFPDARRSEWAFEEAGVVYDERIVPAPDGTAMVLGLVDGVVVDIRWGSAALAEGFTTLYCF